MMTFFKNVSKVTSEFNELPQRTNCVRINEFVYEENPPRASFRLLENAIEYLFFINRPDLQITLIISTLAFNFYDVVFHFVTDFLADFSRCPKENYLFL